MSHAGLGPHPLCDSGGWSLLWRATPRRRPRGEGLRAIQEGLGASRFPWGPSQSSPYCSAFGEHLLWVRGAATVPRVTLQACMPPGKGCRVLLPLLHPPCFLGLLPLLGSEMAAQQQVLTEHRHTGPGTAEQGGRGRSEGQLEAVTTSEGTVKRPAQRPRGQPEDWEEAILKECTISSNLIDIGP